jgi:hypothetical protein
MNDTGAKRDANAQRPESAGGEYAQAASGLPWRAIFRVVRWSMYLAALITLALALHKAPPPSVTANTRAAQRAEQKINEVQQSVANGQPATLRLSEAELNSYLASHLDLSPEDTTPTSDDVAAARSSVKDVKVQMMDDRLRAYVVFGLHGKDMTLQLEGKLGVENGFLNFMPTSGQLGSLPIPHSSLENAVKHMMESPENREKLRLPANISELKIEKGELVVGYK